MPQPLPLSDAEALQDYVADRLSKAERVIFEARLVNDIDLVRDVENSLRLREGLEVLREDGALRRPAHPRRMTVFLGFAGAAALALIAIVFHRSDYFWRSPAVMATSLASLGRDADAPLAINGHFTFAAMRSATHIPEILLPTSGALELRALTSAIGTSRSFSLVLQANRPGRAATRLGTVVGAMSDADGFVVLYVNAATLSPGDYALSVESDAEREPADQQFEFRLRRPAGTASTDH